MNSGTATLTDCTISGNVSSGFGDAGGLLNLRWATLTNCTISNNSSNGAVVITYRGITTLTKCTIRDKDFNDGAAGIMNSGTAPLPDSTITGNVSSGFGDAGGF